MINFRIRSERIIAQANAVRSRVALTRAAWLALLPVLAPILAGILVPERGLPIWPWAVGGAAVFALAVGLGRRPPAESEIIAGLDRRHGLGDLLVTSAEVDRRGARTALERRLLDDGAMAIARLGGERAISDRPVRIERETLVGIALVLFGALTFREALRTPPDPDRLPPIEFASGWAGVDRPGTALGTAAGGRTPGLGPLADALSTTAAGADAEAALRSGDARAGARALRALADRVQDVSPEGRRALGEALSTAADSLGDSRPDVADAARRASEALSDEERSSSDGLSELAAALDSIAGRGFEAVPTPSVLERDGPDLERLAGAGGSDGDTVDGGGSRGTVERSAAGRGAVPAADALDSTRSWRASPSGAEVGAAAGLGAGIPREQRPIVLRYFSAYEREAP